MITKADQLKSLYFKVLNDFFSFDFAEYDYESQIALLSPILRRSVEI